MKRVGLLILLTASVAHADERRTAIDVQAGIGPAIVDDEYGYADAETATMLRARVGWEHAPVPYPLEPGYAWGGSIVPELSLGMMDHESKGESFIQAGVRLEARFAQKEQGLLKVSMRGGMWLAGRAGVVGEHQDSMWEGAMGWYIVLGRSKMRLGWEIAMLSIEGSSEDVPVPGVVRFDTGYDDEATVLQFSAFLGGQL